MGGAIKPLIAVKTAFYKPDGSEHEVATLVVANVVKRTAGLTLIVAKPLPF